jgi:glycosyltransferase involved in cell wall biosynthesis
MCESDICVIVLTYNSSEYLPQTLDAILAQKSSNFVYHVFISDDCSKDNTVDVIKEYTNNYPDKITFRVNEKNLGIAGNIYSTINLVNSKYIFLSASDDFLIDEEFLQKQYYILETNEELSMAVFNGYAFYEKDEKNKFEHIKNFPSDGIYDINYWIANSFFSINVQAFVFRRSSLPPFEEWMYKCEQEDWLLTFLLFLNGKVYFKNEYASMYRMHKANFSHSGSAIRKLLGGILLIENLDKYTGYLYTKHIGDLGWRYERLAYEYIKIKDLKNFLVYTIKFLHSKVKVKQKLNYFKTIIKYLFLGKPISY